MINDHHLAHLVKNHLALRPRDNDGIGRIGGFFRIIHDFKNLLGTGQRRLDGIKHPGGRIAGVGKLFGITKETVGCTEGLFGEGDGSMDSRRIFFFDIIVRTGKHLADPGGGRFGPDQDSKNVGDHEQRGQYLGHINRKGDDITGIGRTRR